MLSGHFFQAWGSLTSLKSQTRDLQLKFPPRGLVPRIFTSWKDPSTSGEFEPSNLEYRDEHVTLRPPKSTSCIFVRANFNSSSDYFLASFIHLWIFQYIEHKLLIVFLNRNVGHYWVFTALLEDGSAHLLL